MSGQTVAPVRSGWDIGLGPRAVTNHRVSADFVKTRFESWWHFIVNICPQSRLCLSRYFHYINATLMHITAYYCYVLDDTVSILVMSDHIFACTA